MQLQQEVGVRHSSCLKLYREHIACQLGHHPWGCIHWVCLLGHQAASRRSQGPRVMTEHHVWSGLAVV